jgi:O-antigen/teichoic acid export membrane protein
MQQTTSNDNTVSSPGPEAGNEHLISSSLSNVSKLAVMLAITIPLSFVTRVLVPRALGSEKAGILFFAESFPLLLLSFMPLGLPVYIQKNVPPHPEHAREIFDSLIGFGALMAMVLLGGLAVYLAFSHFDPLTAQVIGVMACYQAIQIYSNEYLQKIFISLGQYSITSAINIGSKVLTVLFVLGSMWLNGGIIMVAGAFTAAQLIVLLVMLANARRSRLFGGGVSLPRIKAMLLVGAPFFLGGFLSTINSSIDGVCLERWASFAEIGYYGAAQRLLALFLLPVPIIGQVFSPIMSRAFANEREQYSSLITTITRGLMGLACPLAWLFVAFSKEIVGLLYGPQFAPAMLSTMVMGPLLIFSLLATFFAISAVITSTGKSFTAILFCGALINFTTDYFFIPLGGTTLGPGGAAAGAAFSSLCTTTFEMSLFLIVSCRGLLNGKMLYSLLVALLPVLLTAAAGDSWGNINLIYRVLLFAAVVPAYLFLVRLITLDDVSLVIKTLRAKGLVK